MHVARLTVKRFVLQARRRFGGRGQFALDSRPGEGLDGAHAAPGLEHRLVLRTCGFKTRGPTVSAADTREPNIQAPPGGKVRSQVKRLFFF